jgi:hypothetical protein
MRWLACWLMLAAALASASAQEDAGVAPGASRAKDKKTKPAEKKPAERTAAPRKGTMPLPAFTPEIEAAALAFAKEHYSELSDLLVALKSHSKGDYERAVGELYRTSERLAQLKTRDKERYEIDLEAWKIDSRIRIMVARISMDSDNSQFKQLLRAELLKKHDLELKRLLLERERAERRVNTLTAEIERRQAQRDQLADRDVNLLVNTVKNDKRSKRPRDVKKVDVKKPNVKKDGTATQVKVQKDKP